MGVNDRNAQNWTKGVGKRKNIRGWEAFIHFLLSKCLLNTCWLQALIRGYRPFLNGVSIAFIKINTCH